MKCKGTGKVIYETYEKAEKSAKYLHEQSHEPMMKPYKCKHCGYWHLSSHDPVKAYRNKRKRKKQGKPVRRK